MHGPNVTTVSAALHAAFSHLLADVPDDDHDTYLSVSASWTNPSGRLLSMHMSTGGGIDDDDDEPIEVTDRTLSAVPPAPYPDTTR